MWRRVILVLVGCSQAPTPTSAIAAQISVIAHGTSLTTTAILSANGRDPVLAAGDGVRVTGGGASVLIAPIKDGVRSGTFVADNSAGVGFTVSLVREAGGGAPSSTCTLPAASSPTLSASSLSRKNDVVTVTYNGGSSDVVSWIITGDCVSGSGTVTNDTGTFAILPSSLVEKTKASCAAAFILIRSRRGAVDPALAAGSSIECSQDRSVAFTSTP